MQRCGAQRAARRAREISNKNNPRPANNTTTKKNQQSKRTERSERSGTSTSKKVSRTMENRGRAYGCLPEQKKWRNPRGTRLNDSRSKESCEGGRHGGGETSLTKGVAYHREDVAIERAPGCNGADLFEKKKGGYFYCGEEPS